MVAAPATRARTRSAVGVRVSPVVLWSTVGAAAVLLQIWIYARWLTSGHLHATGTGATAVPTHTKVFAWAFQGAGVVMLVAFLFFVVIRPWRKAGRITVDGRMAIAFALVYWQDPLINYFKTWATYNSYLLNVGSWSAQIPGWQSPNGDHFPEPILMFLPAYIYGVYGLTIVGAKIMDRARQRWSLSGFSTYLVGVGLFFCADVVLEVPWVLCSLDAFGGSVRALTLFPGSRFQLPLWEPLLFAPTYALWGYLRLTAFANDVAFAERGVDRLRVGSRSKTVLRTLSLVGAVNAIFLIYQVPVALLGRAADRWPQSVSSISYLTYGTCC